MYAEQPGAAPAAAALPAAAAADPAPGLALLRQTQQPGEAAGTQRPDPGREGQSRGAAPAEAEQGSRQPAAAASLEGAWSLPPAETAALRSQMGPPHRAQQATAATRQGSSAAAERPAARPGGGRGQQPPADRQGCEAFAELIARPGAERSQQPALTGGAGPRQAEVASVQAGLCRLQQLEGRLSTSGSGLSGSGAPSDRQRSATQPQRQNSMPAPQGRVPVAGLRQDGLQGGRLAHSETAQCAAPADTAARQLTQNAVKPQVQSVLEAAAPAPASQHGSGQAGQAAAAKPSAAVAAAAASTLVSPPAANERRRQLSSSGAPAAATKGIRSGSKSASKSERCGNLQGSAAAGSSPMKQMTKRQ